MLHIPMLRGVIFLALIAIVALIASPFVASSLYIDQRGTSIPGHVYSKREDVSMQYSSLNITSQATFEYSKPDGSGVSFFNVQLPHNEYDAIRVGQSVALHYLREEDIPDLPLARSLRSMQLLPTVRLANRTAFTGLAMSFTTRVLIYCLSIAGVLILLCIWRMLHAPGISWAIVTCAFLALVAVYAAQFPRPMRSPVNEVRYCVGHVKRLERMDRLFSGSHSRGWHADQPIDVVGIEFIPEGRTEKVLAVDLIDAGSVLNLKEKSSVAIEYERASPRTAYIRGATRNFTSRNLNGIVWQASAFLAVIAALLGGAKLLGRVYKRAIRIP